MAASSRRSGVRVCPRWCVAEHTAGGREPHLSKAVPLAWSSPGREVAAVLRQPLDADAPVVVVAGVDVSAEEVQRSADDLNRLALHITHPDIAAMLDAAGVTGTERGERRRRLKVVESPEPAAGLS
jgi:hypothetical protein